MNTNEDFGLLTKFTFFIFLPFSEGIYTACHKKEINAQNLKVFFPIRISKGFSNEISQGNT